MGLDSVRNYLKVENSFLNETHEDKYKQVLIPAIIKRDFEVLYKQIQLSNLLGDISFYNNPLDELISIDHAISLSFGKNISDVNYEIRELLAEVCCVSFFTLVNSKKIIIDSELVELANKLGQLIYKTTLRIKGLFESQYLIEFFDEFKKIFPTLKIEYFEKNFQAYLNRPSGIDGGG